jgi:hypothetical protein
MTRTLGVARALSTLTLALLLAVAGCGDSSTAPTAPAAPAPGGTPSPAPAAGPDLLKVNADGSVTWVPAPTGLLASPKPYELDDELDPSRFASTTVRVDGAVGGRIVCGRFVATVPAGAFEGVGTITLSMPDTLVMLCDLEITPAELNQFKRPVDLSLRTTGTNTELDSLELYYWNPETTAWEGMGCLKSSDLEPVLEVELELASPAVGVRLPLLHFSRYAGGKAGW